jgi:small subunit ribosomal protein S17e
MMIVPHLSLQGRVRTKTVKRSARVIVERYYPKLTLDFDTNKRVTDEVAVVPSKRMRNKIAGFVTVSSLQLLMPRYRPGAASGVAAHG